MITVSSNVVTGRRVPWWRAVLAQPGYAAFVFASPPVLLAVLYKLVFRHAGMDGLSYAFWGGLALAAATGCVLLNLARNDGTPLEAECPACGTRGIWSYTPPVDRPDPRGQLCAACGAYAGTNGLELRELPIGAKGEFEIDSERYAREVRRDAQSRIMFEMPAFCAICGSDDAVSRRKLDVFSSGPAGSDEVWRQLNYAATGNRGQMASARRPDSIRGSDLEHIEVPVCERHVSAPSQPGPMWTNDAGTLRFSSYRYYKAFCAANRVAAPNGSHAFPSARVV